MRVLFLSGREKGYIRNRTLIRALQQFCEVIVLSRDRGGIVWRSIAGMIRFLAQHPKYDCCFCGFYGQPLALALAALQNKPIILDAFVSTYDTLCLDRQIFSPTSPLGRLSYWLDLRSCLAATRILTDTQAHAHYFAETFHIPLGKISSVYVGCDEQDFKCAPQPPTGNPAVVFYYGSFLPLHGTDIIIQAAELLRHRKDIEFVLGGDGPQRKHIQRMMAEGSLRNVRWIEWIPFQEIQRHIAAATVCLGGHFSTYPKAARVISTKTFQFLAMGKPVIVGDNPATRELFTNGQEAIAVPMGDPVRLAEAIQNLVDQPELRSQISAAGYALYRRQLTIEALSHRLSQIVSETVNNGHPLNSIRGTV